MSVVNISSSWSSPDANPEQLAQLAVTLSRGLTRVLMDDIAPAIGDALAQIALAAHADGCQLLEFAASGVVTRVHVPTRPAKVAAPEHQALAPEEWLVERLKRGDLVNISRAEELPREAIVSRDQARRTGPCSILAIPASPGGEVVCALVIDSSRSRRWSTAARRTAAAPDRDTWRRRCSGVATRARFAPTSR